jgi:hypothetical protein
MNPDFNNNTKQLNNYYKYNNHQAGYGMPNQFNPQLQVQQAPGQGPNYMNNPYGGYLPEQYQNVYFNPYGGYQATGVGVGMPGPGGVTTQNPYPYNFNYQGHQQPSQIFDQNANSQYQQMILNSLSANPLLTQANPQAGVSINTNNIANSNANINIPQAQAQGQSMSMPISQDQYQVDLNNQYLQQIQMGGYMVPGYDFNQMNMNMIQLIPQDQILSQSLSQNDVNEAEEKKLEGQIEN